MNVPVGDRPPQPASPHWAAKGAAITAAALLWASLIAGGFVLLARHDFAVLADQPGSPTAWPAGSGLPRPAGTAALLVFAHPHCPCTRATLAELDRLAARAPGRFAATLVLVGLPGDPEPLMASEHARAARAIPGVTVIPDPDGAEARRFGATTSGQVFFFDAASRLRYRGGITPSRGHQGDSLGRAALLAVLEDPGAPPLVTLPTFGCALVTPAGGPQS